MNDNSRPLELSISCFNVRRGALSISIRLATRHKDGRNRTVVKKEKAKLDGCFTPKTAAAESKDGSEVVDTKIEIQVTEESEEYQALIRRLNYPA